MEKSIFELTGGAYERQGDYILPKLRIGDTTEYPVGIWGQRYRRYLKENHRIIYYDYLTEGTLNRHLAEVDERASEMFNHLVKQLSEQENVTENLKVDDLMEWIRRTNNIRSRAAEIVYDDIFCL